MSSESSWILKIAFLNNAIRRQNFHFSDWQIDRFTGVRCLMINIATNSFDWVKPAVCLYPGTHSTVESTARVSHTCASEITNHSVSHQYPVFWNSLSSPSVTASSSASIALFFVQFQSELETFLFNGSYCLSVSPCERILWFSPCIEVIS